LNDLQWPFQGHDYSTSNNLKMVQHTDGRLIESRIWSIERRHFQWPWTSPTFSFKVAPFFDAQYPINGSTYRHSFNEILIGAYTRPTQLCHFEWPWVTLSHLAKYLMTGSVARSLCDSWAFCLRLWSDLHCESKNWTLFHLSITFLNTVRF